MLLKNLHSPADGKQCACHWSGVVQHWTEVLLQYLLQQMIRCWQMPDYGIPCTSNEIHDRRYCFVNRIAFGSGRFTARWLSSQTDVPGFVVCFPLLLFGAKAKHWFY